MSLSGRVFALVNDNGTARRESHAFQQLTTSGYQLTGQPFILLQVHLRATVSSDNLHFPPLLRAIMTSSATRSRCPAAPPCPDTMASDGRSCARTLTASL